MITRVARTAGQVLVMVAVLYAVMVGLGLLITKVADDTWPLTVEDNVNEDLADGRTQDMNDVTHMLSGFGETIAIVAALLVVAVFLRIALKRWTESIFLVLAVSAQALIFLFTTMVIDRQRPDVGQLDDSPPTSSFPSGHAGAATALFIGSALLVSIHLRRRWLKILSVALLIAVPVLVAYARLYRGMHHPSDIAGSVINGLACVSIAAVAVLGRGWRGEGKVDPQVAPEAKGATPAEQPSSTTR
jgi:membrane-associated phospholipid phosphatase